MTHSHPEIIAEQNCEAELQQQLTAAIADKTPLRIHGGQSKTFYGLPVETSRTLDISAHQGVINYEPTELAITLRAGTPLKQVETLLQDNGQHFPFEPPKFGEQATIGGMIACGLSGPARAYRGSVRDAMLGTRMMNGKGEVLNFGGQVMKNVAGYDTSRLMVGALGTLGVLLEVSLKVLPNSLESRTIALELSADEALENLRRWSRQTLPITASCWTDGQLFLRISGTTETLTAAEPQLGGEIYDDGENLWRSIQEQQHNFFTASELPLWRLSVAPAKPLAALPGKRLIEWGGALHWLKSDAPADDIQQAAKQAGGHATLFRYRKDALPADGNVFAPLSPLVQQFHQQLKLSFDPAGLFNPSRLYREL